MAQKKLIIDTDAGVDDAVSLLMAFALINRAKLEKQGGNGNKRTKLTSFPNPSTISGITCVEGNVELEKVSRNVVTCLRKAEITDIPVYLGACQPLLREKHSASFWHGEDGLGDVLSQKDREDDLAWAKEHNVLQGQGSFGNPAVDFIIRTVMESEQGCVDILALGPLTNIALALRLEPRLAARLGRCVVMGGSVRGRGNITKAAEFNFYADPDAAHICFDTENGGLKTVELVDWDFCLRFSIEWDFWEKLRKSNENSFMVRMSQDIVRKSRNQHTAFPLADPLAMFVMLNPEGVLERSKRRVHIELDGTHTRGMTIVDWGSHDSSKNNESTEHYIVERIDMDAYHELIELGALYC